MDGIAYVEMNVMNLQATSAYFTDRWDFAAVAEAHLPGQHSMLLRAGDVQLVLSAPEGPDSPIRDWIEEHGEGVADVATYCPEIIQIAIHAVEAGLPVQQHEPPKDGGHLSTTVGGLGSIRHTLVTAQDPIAPPRFPWVRLRTARRRSNPDSSASRLQLIDHVAVCVPHGSLGAAAHLYEKVFGLHEVSRETLPAHEVGPAGMDSRVLRDPSGALTYVIVEPTADSRGGQVEAFLTAHGGAGVQHLAFSTTDICATVTTYTRRGVTFCPTPSTYYDQIKERIPDHRGEVSGQLEDLRRTGVLVTSDHGGLLHQIFSTSPHHGELFYELIERGPGATGFGSDNIRALFAARAAATSAEMGLAG